MRASVQLGLLCLSLIIYSLDGGEIDAEQSREQPPNFALDMEDVPEFQVSENEPEHLSHDPDIIPVNFRVKRQDKNRNNKRKKSRPGSKTLLSSMSKPSTRVKRQTDSVEQKKPNKLKLLKPREMFL